MHKNEDRALNPVELTNEELSLASGGYYPGYYYYGGYDFVDQDQFNLQNQKAYVYHGYNVHIHQTQVNLQNQGAYTH